jgi:hypothetical protein
MAHSAFGRLRPVFDFGEQFRLDPDAAAGDALGIGLGVADQRREARAERLSGSASGRSVANFIRPFPDARNGHDRARCRSWDRLRKSTRPTICGLRREPVADVRHSIFPSGEGLGLAPFRKISLGALRQEQLPCALKIRRGHIPSPNQTNGWAELISTCCSRGPWPDTGAAKPEFAATQFNFSRLSDWAN